MSYVGHVTCNWTEGVQLRSRFVGSAECRDGEKEEERTG